MRRKLTPRLLVLDILLAMRSGSERKDQEVKQRMWCETSSSRSIITEENPRFLSKLHVVNPGKGTACGMDEEEQFSSFKLRSQLSLSL